LKKITIYGAGDSATYEEIGAIELLKGNGGVPIEVILPEGHGESHLHTARLVLSTFGVEVSVYTPGAFEKSEVLVSFGRPEVFSTIQKFSDRPRKLVYGLSGVAPLKLELKAHTDGLIDEVFVKSRSKGVEAVRALVKKTDKGVEFRGGYVPFCNPSSDFFKLEFEKKKPSECFHVMQNTPDVPGFCFPDHWLTIAKITCPHPKTKLFTALNWGKNLSKCAGNPGDSGSPWNRLIDTVLENPNRMNWELEKSVYAKASALLHFYPEEDAFSFAAAKAILSGTVVVGSPAPAFLELIKHGETGFFAKTADEAAYYTSRLAWEPFLRLKLATEAYASFVNDGPGNPDTCLPWWKGVFDG
jgi:glycosyltransferase involved in cell wall biosynthesis